MQRSNGQACGVALRLQHACPAIAGAVILALTNPTAAQNFPPITSRDWAVDLYEGTAFGSNRVIAMGGVAVAIAEGSAGSLANPAAMAVRPTTDNDWFGWDFHLDAASGSLSTDYDNNGQLDGANGNKAATAGLAFGFGLWAVALTATTWTTPMDGLGTTHLDASITRGEFAVSRLLPAIDVATGVGVRIGAFDVQSPTATLFGISTSSAVAGATWMPRMQSLRVAGSATIGRSNSAVSVGTCDPLNCEGHILPERIAVPWRLALGGAYRLGPSAWNVKVPSIFRDEHSVIASAELTVTGPIANGFGIEAFGQGGLQRSGRNVAISPRVGVEYEALPGRLRMRAGTYWEPGRFVDSDGRMHATGGIEVALFDFCVWGPRRLRLTLTTDVARNYRNGGISVGFWH
ncbi:MAG: hypothetical protein KBG15_05540 [Kofleriaceae bacterium]|nr:hypothetical protein [Kofleriaceae bacterium]